MNVIIVDITVKELSFNKCASSGSACSSGIEDGSDVLRAIGLNTNDLNASIRFSFGIHNTQSDVDNAVNYIKKAIDNYN